MDICWKVAWEGRAYTVGSDPSHTRPPLVTPPWPLEIFGWALWCADPGQGAGCGDGV